MSQITFPKPNIEGQIKARFFKKRKTLQLMAIQFILFNEDISMIRVLKQIYLIILQTFIFITEVIRKFYAFKYIEVLAKKRI